MVGAAAMLLAGCGSSSTSSAPTTAGASTTSLPAAVASTLPGVPANPLPDTAANAPLNARYACAWDDALTDVLTGGSADAAEAAGQGDTQQIESFADAAGAQDPTYAKLAADGNALATYGFDASWGELAGLLSAPQVSKVENDCESVS
jgi:hypothetical protein